MGGGETQFPDQGFRTPWDNDSMPCLQGFEAWLVKMVEMRMGDEDEIHHWQIPEV